MTGRFTYCSFFALFLIPTVLFAQTQDISGCLEELVLTQSDETTIGELKAQCDISQKPANANKMRIFNRGNADTSTPFQLYKENYIAAGRMQNDNGTEPFSGEKVDIHFQFSFKYQIFHPENNGHLKFLAPLHVAYTQKSWWDIAEPSAPFVEHNFNPEVFWDFPKLALNSVSLGNRLGLEHESNGRDGPESRSWNKIYWKGHLESGSENFSMDLKLWDAVDVADENSDIKDYLGYAELSFGLHLSNKFLLNTAFTKGKEHSKVNTQIDLIYKPLQDFNPRLFLSYYSGYGEALISYNVKTESLRLGFDFPVD